MKKLSKRSGAVENTVAAFSYCSCYTCTSKCGGSGTAESAIQSTIRAQADYYINYEM